MSSQLEISFSIHSHENNKESQSFLNENRYRLSAQCRKVYDLLKQGVRLTTINSRDYNILSLPRRIKDLRDLNGVEIKETWIPKSDGTPGHKMWFI